VPDAGVVVGALADAGSSDPARPPTRALDAGRSQPAPVATRNGAHPRPGPAHEPPEVAPPVVASPVAALPPEAAPPDPPPIDASAAPPSPGHVIVKNDAWCDVWIDGAFHGRGRNELIEVSAGHHSVRCVNPAGQWTQDVEVAPGQTATLRGAVLHDLKVTLDIDATIDGKPYPRGAVIRLKQGRIEVVAGGQTQFITLRTDCRLKDVPGLGCYE
jgi:hypothetical protein